MGDRTAPEFFSFGISVDGRIFATRNGQKCSLADIAEGLAMVAKHVVRRLSEPTASRGDIA